jgi:hypothetical protein
MPSCFFSLFLPNGNLGSRIVGQAFLMRETADDIDWVLSRFTDVIGAASLKRVSVVMTDEAAAFTTPVRARFPVAKHLLCRYMVTDFLVSRNLPVFLDLYIHICVCVFFRTSDIQMFLVREYSMSITVLSMKEFFSFHLV